MKKLATFLTVAGMAVLMTGCVVPPPHRGGGSPAPAPAPAPARMEQPAPAPQGGARHFAQVKQQEPAKAQPEKKAEPQPQPQQQPKKDPKEQQPARKA